MYFGAEREREIKGVGVRERERKSICEVVYGLKRVKHHSGRGRGLKCWPAGV